MARKKMHLKLKQGALHRELHVPAGQKIPVSSLKKSSHSDNPVLRKRSQFALNARKWKH